MADQQTLMQRLTEFAQPAINYLNQPVIGPIKGWHILFFFLFQAFQAFTAPKRGNSVTASHILVKEEAEAKELLEKIKEDPTKFEELAEKHSSCPSKSKGGDLGQMVPEFDKVCFDKETVVGEVYGPVKTSFGYHLIKVTKASPERENKKTN
ncbi:hypothetical protein HK099_005482 [Clydaea vesicula]|uniref:Peptidyl-prolyl cis-trans isomerase n=1 Tax=Clydaea vesicula TaxID=447962 RepID=A0AAD5TZ69_9FUNG|nr:hypothetical protein HK099_005482 [Clydaea vesicula]